MLLYVALLLGESRQPDDVSCALVPSSLARRVGALEQTYKKSIPTVKAMAGARRRMWWSATDDGAAIGLPGYV